MPAPTSRPALWYVLAALIVFVGALLFDGFFLIGLNLGGSPSLANVNLYLYAALLSYLALIRYYSSSAKWLFLFSPYLVSFILSFFNLQLAIGLLGLSLLADAIGGAVEIRARPTSCLVWLFSLQLGYLGLGASGAYALLSAFVANSNRGEWFRLTHPWLGGIIVILWVTAMAWYLLDRGLAREEEVFKTLRNTCWIILVAGGVGLVNHLLWFFGEWFWRPLPVLLRFAELMPLYVLLFNSLASRGKPAGGVVGFWSGWVILLTVSGLLMPLFSGYDDGSTLSWGFHLRALAWPLVIVGLILFTQRYLRRLIQPIPWAGKRTARTEQKLLMTGFNLHFLAFWQVALGIAAWNALWLKALIIGNLILLLGYLRFIAGLLTPKRLKVELGQWEGESHLVNTADKNRTL